MISHSSRSICEKSVFEHINSIDTYFKKIMFYYCCKHFSSTTATIVRNAKNEDLRCFKIWLLNWPITSKFVLVDFATTSTFKDLFSNEIFECLKVWYHDTVFRMWNFMNKNCLYGGRSVEILLYWTLRSLYISSVFGSVKLLLFSGCVWLSVLGIDNSSVSKCLCELRNVILQLFPFHFTFRIYLCKSI